MRIEEISDDVESGCSSTFQDEFDHHQPQAGRNDEDEEIFYDAAEPQHFYNNSKRYPFYGDERQHDRRRRQQYQHHHHLPMDLQFRTILPKDRTQIQNLHETWFPVVYQQEFYDQLVYGKMCHTGEPLYTNLACRRSGGSSSGGGIQPFCSFNPEDNCRAVCDGKQEDDEEEEIIACLVGSVVQDTRLNRTSRQLLLPNPQKHCRLFYIMTLGTVTEYRSLGLASSLIQQCVANIVNKDPKCGALYLHVITINQAAIKFYERLGFWRVQEIPDYYTIDGQNYNCYLYAKYFNGKEIP